MVKNLSERIAARLEKSTAKAKRSNKVVFLALRDEIEKALNDGWTVKIIWETLQEEKRVTFSYQAFNRYVQQLIKNRPPAQDKPVSEAPEKQSKPQGIKEFKFNANPKKEDLI
jgi:hypothetical protein